MILFALSDLTWITIVGTVCSMITTVVSIIVTKKVSLTQKSIEENTQVTTESARKAQVAAGHAAAAAKVGVETLRQVTGRGKAVAEMKEQIKELQEESSLKKGHIKGDEKNGD